MTDLLIIDIVHIHWNIFSVSCCRLFVSSKLALWPPYSNGCSPWYTCLMFGEFVYYLDAFYAPNFKKVGSILLSACPCVCACVRACVRPSVPKKIRARVLKFHIWIPRQKIAYPYFFSYPNYLPLPSYGPFKG